jgi:uncharacterized protein (TIGR00290 family)
MLKKAFFNWSGGKDSALALYRLLNDQDFEITTLLTSINADSDRISMHGVRSELLFAQAKSIGLPIETLKLPSDISMSDYDTLMGDQVEDLKNKGATHAVFGDIFLEDLKKYREERLQEKGMKAVFPLWGNKTSLLIQEFIALGFKTIVVAIDGSKLDKSFVGKVIDQSVINDLPEGIDPCGENGEFHTFVFEGPIFKQPIKFSKGEVVAKEYVLNKQTSEKVTYWFQELLPV